MLAGINFTQLGYGDILIDKNWSYRNLWGLAASRQKLIDQFRYSKEIGFNIIYDSIRPIYDNNGQLTLSGVGYNSNVWPLYDPINHNDRISLYKKEVIGQDFKFICRLEFPDRLTKDNMDKYVNFFVSLVKNPDFSWIENWTFFENPEQLIYISERDEYIPEIDPSDYVQFLKKARQLGKQVNPNIKIGGPGIQKAIGTLMPNNPLRDDHTFYHNWLIEAFDNSLLNYIDFFTLQLRQQVMGLEYDYVYSLSILLKEKLKAHAGEEQIMPIYSFHQGRQELDRENVVKLKDQMYYNISEMLNTAKNGIIPIINEIADPPSDLKLNPNYDPNEDGYGLFKFDLTRKPQVEYFKFILGHLKKYTRLTTSGELYKNPLADDITFINNDSNTNSSTIISVIWSKYKKENKIVILPNADQKYHLVDGSEGKIINPFEFETTTDFIVVIQNIYTELVDYADLRSTIFKKFIYNIETRRNLLNAVPVNYNTSIEDTNFYKVLRTFSLDFADLKVEVDTLRDNAYLDTVQKDSIYKNFGSMVNLEKQSDWNYEKYRRLIQGVIKSLLTGPTKQSIEEAVNLFINYDSVYSDKDKLADIKIYELYKNEGADPAIYNGIHTQFAFIVEVSKDIDTSMNQEVLDRDLKYIINILKPAHTLSFYVVILSGSENYKEWYYKNHGIEFKDMDKVDFDGGMGGANGTIDGIYGWKHLDYSGCFHTFDWKNKKHMSKLNGGVLIGPRRTFVDNDIVHSTTQEQEIIREPYSDLSLVTGWTGCPLLTWKYEHGHINCDVCPNKELCNTHAETPSGTNEIYPKPNEGYLEDEDYIAKTEFIVEPEEDNRYNRTLIYQFNISRFITKVPSHYNNGFPVHESDPYRPVGVGRKMKEGVHFAEMYKIVTNEDGTQEKIIIKSTEDLI